MYHFILLMPVIGLVVFWIWPFGPAMLIYLIILTVSGLLYAKIIKSMRRPVITGREGLRGEAADVLDITGHAGHVRIHGEIWRAVSEDDLRPGDHARVVDIDGLTVKIKRDDGSSPTGSHI
jgi:membrane protein implicated in regulation of membrane protease activity